MAVLRPFRAFRYDQHTPHTLDRLVAPLWESLTPELMQQLYLQPTNALHLSVPHSAQEAHQHWLVWRKEGVVVQDPLPAYYPWFQRFSLYGSPKIYERRGFVALVRLNSTDSDPDIVVHEDTLRPVVQERASLLETLPLHVTPIHGLYFDPEFVIENLLEAYRANPLVDLVDQQGVRHCLSMMQHPEDLELITRRLSTQRIYLADGHHRLKSAEMYRNKLRQTGSSHTNAAEYVPMYLSNYAADDLRILPTHRLVDLPVDFDVQAFIESLNIYFTCNEFDRRQPLTDQLKERSRCFGLLLKDRQLLIELKPQLDVDQLIELPFPHSVKKLNYTLLHYLLIDRLLGIPYAEQNANSRIGYFKDLATVFQAVNQSNQPRMGILVNEVSMDDLLAVCADGARMPQKSTYFFPKLLSGLLFASVHDDDFDSRFDLGL